jgi:hypothetical protein
LTVKKSEATIFSSHKPQVNQTPSHNFFLSTL